jgi:hypothetical protein
MKCATSALHAYLDAHPDIAMSRLKELNFFNGPEQPPHEDADTWWVDGQWHRGLDWYAAQFDPDVRVRGESSPAYTSPSSPEAPPRMAAVLPRARLVYLVRDPVERAVSQWAHHRRDGTEPRPVEEAVLDPRSQYVARSRYFERVAPYLDHFADEQLRVVVQERLFADPAGEVAAVYRHAGVDPAPAARLGEVRSNAGDDRPPVPDGLRAAFRGRVADDVERLRAWTHDALPEWAA